MKIVDTKRVEFQESLSHYEGILEWGSSSYKLSFVSGIVQNPRTGKETTTSHKFLVDTGASISILNNEFKSFIDGTFKEVDYVNIQYGHSRVRLPVYEMVMIINGTSFPCRMAYDKDLTLPSLLGQFGFLNQFNFIVVDYKKNNHTKFIKEL